MVTVGEDHVADSPFRTSLLLVLGSRLVMPAMLLNMAALNLLE